MRSALLFVMALALAGCQLSEGGLGGGAGLGLFAARPAADAPGAEAPAAERASGGGGLLRGLRSAPESVRLARGQVIVGGPEGYCVDRRASKRGGGAAFVLLASCASLSDAPEAGAPAAPGLLTASVDARPGEVPAPEAFLSYFGSEEGRAALARDGRAGSVDVLEARVQDGALVMKIRDRSPVATPGLEGTYWRGLFALNGRLITVTVNAFEQRPMGTDAGRGKLTAFIARIRALSPPN